jgi:hypothetical protein
MTIRPFFEPCDLWIGAFWSKSSRALYLMPIPMLGLRVALGPKRFPADERVLVALRVTDPPTIAAIKAGARELSIGYTANPEPPRNPWQPVAIGLLLVIVALLALASVAMMIGGPR